MEKNIPWETSATQKQHGDRKRKKGTVNKTRHNLVDRQHTTKPCGLRDSAGNPLTGNVKVVVEQSDLPQELGEFLKRPLRL